MITRIVCLVALVALALPAQLPSPPKQLEKFDATLGHWTGEGTVVMQKGMPEMKWTSRTHARKIMGGHFIRDDTRIDLVGMPGSLCFINFIAYDTHLGRFIQYTIGSHGQLGVNEIDWIDDQTFETVHTSMEMGKRTVERWIHKISDDKVSYTGQSADTGAWWTHVKGTNVRQKQGKTINLDIAAFMDAPAPEEMKKLSAMNGHYDMAGKWAMAPESPMQDFDGTEKIRSLWGGHVQETVAAGSNDYQGYGALVWNARDKTYRRFHLSSFGGFHGVTEASWAGEDELSFTQSAIFMGQRMISRSNLKLDDQGRLHSVNAYAMMPMGKPFNSFKAKYTLKAAKLGGN